MITSNIKKIVVSVTAAFIAITLSFGQIKQIGNFTAGGLDDAQKLMKAYITPWANALGASMSGGWYNTAKVHKTLGFDITFTLNMGFVPSSDKTFNLDDLDLNLLYDDNIAQTAAGKKQAGPELRYEMGGIQLASFESPKGTGLSFVPSPMVQIGVGLVKGTALDFRFLPEVKMGNTGNTKLWGLGLKHDILQWIPGLSKVPVLNAALQGGYTKFTLGNDISFLPENINVATDPALPAGYFDGQRMSLEVTSFTMNLLVSANLPVICFYGGMGIANTKTTLGLDGFYPIPTLVNTIPTVNESSAAEIPSIEIKNNEGSPTKPRFNIGLRLKLGPITIHGDYTKANYSNVTAGLGISFR